MIAAATASRYRSAAKAEKGRILDELVAQTGWHRKHAVRALRQPRGAPRPPLYGEEVREGLVVAWEASGRPCGKRLKELLPGLVRRLVKDGRLPRDLFLRGKLLAISAATIDRLLRPARRESVLAAAGRRLEEARDAIAGLAAFTIPAELPPHEREHLAALHRDLIREFRRFNDSSG